MAKRIVSDAKADYPAACNAMVIPLLGVDSRTIYSLQNVLIFLVIICSPFYAFSGNAPGAQGFGK